MTRNEAWRVYGALLVCLFYKTNPKKYFRLQYFVHINIAPFMVILILTSPYKNVTLTLNDALQRTWILLHEQQTNVLERNEK